MRSLFLYLCTLMIFLIAGCSSSNVNTDKEFFRMIISPLGLLEGSYLVEVSEDGYMMVWRGSRSVKDAYNKERIYDKKYMKKKVLITESMLNTEEMERLEGLLDNIYQYEETQPNIHAADASYFFIGYREKTYGFDTSFIYSAKYSSTTPSEEKNLNLEQALAFEALMKEIKEHSPVTPEDWRF